MEKMCEKHFTNEESKLLQNYKSIFSGSFFVGYTLVTKTILSIIL